eukprot:1027921-Lingulodinium_polyedra.AAC.1
MASGCVERCSRMCDCSVRCRECLTPVNVAGQYFGDSCLEGHDMAKRLGASVSANVWGQAERQ